MNIVARWTYEDWCGEYYSDSARACPSCSSTCARYVVREELMPVRGRRVWADVTCWCCRREREVVLRFDGDELTARRLSAWDREGVR